MTTHDAYAPDDELLHDVFACSDLSRTYREKMVEAIRTAHANGRSIRVIAQAAGLSHQRIHQIVREA